MSAASANFQIKGSLTLTAPNGGQVWIVGASQPITWTETGTTGMGNVDLSYSINGGADGWNNTISTNTVAYNAGSYTWTIPNAISSQISVKIADHLDATVYAVSAANLTIKGSLTLTAPTGGQTFYVGNSTNITWTYQGSIGNVELMYSTNSGSTFPNIIASSVAPGSSPYAWTIPNSISTTVVVEVVSLSDATVYSESSTGNPITIKGIVSITSPVGTEQWVVGSTHNITWNSTGSVGNVELIYSTDAGNTYPGGNTIIGSISGATGTYSWTIPDNITSTARVEVSDLADATVSSASPANFTIAGALSYSLLPAVRFGL